jgi:hypothetical protein
MKDRQIVTSSFRDKESADKAYAKLLEKGYTERDIHVLMSDETRKKLGGKDVKLEHGNKALQGAGVGGAVGGAVGATILGVAAAATSIAFPGIGLVVAGPIAGALIGGAAGATAGGIAGTLVGMGIPEDQAKVFDEDLRHGSIVLGVSPKDEADASYFENEWRTSGQHVYR